MHVARAAIARDVKFYKRAMRRFDARINLIRQPVLLHAALHAIHIPAILAAKVGVLKTESAFVIRRGHRSIRPAHRPAFTIRDSGLRRRYWPRRRRHTRPL